MLTNKTRKSQNTPFMNNETEVGESLIKQVNYLQKVIGNKEVETLINKGIINQDTSPDPELGIIASEKKKEEYETVQIKKDREELMEEVEQKLSEKKDQVDSLFKSAPGAGVYVNVKTHLVYAQIPGTPSSLFYHYTDLVDVEFSYQDIKKTGQPQKTKRGEIIPFTYSFKYEPIEDEFKNEENQELDEKIEKEETPGKEKAPPLGKKDPKKKKKGEYIKTILNTAKKEKKG